MVQRLCAVSGSAFEITAADEEFYRRAGPVFGGTSFPLPPPALSPPERLRRRLAFRQERHLYRTTCAHSGRPLVSVFSPDKKLRVVDKDLFTSLDNRLAGRDFDFSRPFFDQFEELYRSTYKPNVTQSGEVENCEYGHFVGWMKNGYLVFDSGQSEDSAYAVFMGYCKDCVDCYLIANSELCYEVVKGEQCYNVLFGTRVSNCNFSAFLDDCIGCSHCLGCVNLHNKEYRIFNQPVSKAVFEKTWAKVFSGSWRALAQFRREYERFRLTQPRRALYHLNAGRSTGDDLTDCDNVLDSFNGLEARNSRFLYDCYFGTENCYDVNSWGEGMEWCCELSGCGGLKGKTGMTGCLFGSCLYYGGHNLLYCISCLDKSQDLFGCCDLVKQRYCILNKQYTKAEYEELVPKIIRHMQQTGEWGEFFPLRLSLFGYNESLAQEEFPLSEEEARALGAQWSTYEAEPRSALSGVRAAELPDALPSPEEVARLVVTDEESGKPFRFTASEIGFYGRHGLPLPREHFITRHIRRRARLNLKVLWQRHCAKTGAPILTSYTPDRADIVYSEQAYQAALL